MKLVETQAMFEDMWNVDPNAKALEGMRTSDKMFVVYFTATWCKFCKNIDLDKVDEAATKKKLTLWKVEHTQNDFTAGFCSVRAFPTFMAFQPKKVVGQFQSSNTEDICRWIESLK